MHRLSWLQGPALELQTLRSPTGSICAPALINDQECNCVKKDPEAGSVLSGKETK